MANMKKKVFVIRKDVLIQAVPDEGILVNRSLDIKDNEREKILELLESIPFLGVYTRGKDTSIGYIANGPETGDVLQLRTPVANLPDVLKHKRVELVCIEGNHKVYLHK